MYSQIKNKIEKHARVCLDSRLRSLFPDCHSYSSSLTVMVADTDESVTVRDADDTPEADAGKAGAFFPARVNATRTVSSSVPT